MTALLPPIPGCEVCLGCGPVQARISWLSGIRTVTAELSVRYLLPVPMGQRLQARARLVEAGQRSYRTAGELRLADGRVAATATGLFAVPQNGTFGAPAS